MRRHALWVFGLAAITAACGNTTEQSAATGGLGGAAVGALVGGPVGAVVGAGIGAGAGAGVEYAQETNLVDRMRERVEGEGQEQKASASAPREDVRQAQLALRDQGLYQGPIDGIAGPRTRDGLAQFQQRQGLPQTAELDSRTRDMLMEGQTAQVPQQQSQPRALR